jgi:hypothetical protein
MKRYTLEADTGVEDSGQILMESDDPHEIEFHVGRHLDWYDLFIWDRDTKNTKWFKMNGKQIENPQWAVKPRF